MSEINRDLKQPLSKVFSEPRVPVAGKMQIIMMRGAHPIIIGSKILIDKTKTQIVYNNKNSNLVVDEGRLVLNQVMCGESDADPIFYFCTGTGGYFGEPDCSVPPSPPLGSDTDLYAPLFQKEISSLDHPNALATTFVTIVTETESNGNLTEFALKTRSGRTFARRTTRPMWKDEQVFFVCRWTIQY
jgi:hypothetical protein